MRIKYTTESPFAGFLMALLRALRSLGRGRSAWTASAWAAVANLLGANGDSGSVRVLLGEGEALVTVLVDRVRLDMVAGGDEQKRKT